MNVLAQRYRPTNSDRTSATITPDQTKEWLETYGATERMIFLHPSDLTCTIAETGQRRQLINGPTFNTDKDAYLLRAKKTYLLSEEFRHLPVIEQQVVIRRLGVGEELCVYLCGLPGLGEKYQALLGV